MPASLRSDVDHIVDSFYKDWVLQLDRDDHISLGLFLCFQLTENLDMGATKAAEVAGLMVGKSDKTVRDWRKHFLENNGQIPDNKESTSPVLWGTLDKWASE